MRLIGIFLALSCALPACSSGGSGAGTFTTSVSSDKTINTLSDADALTYCNDFVKWEQGALTDAESKSADCAMGSVLQETLAAGTSGAFDKAKCHTFFDTCMSSTAKPKTTLPDCTKFKASSTGCTATVGQYDQCITDTVQQFKALAAQGGSVCDTYSPSTGLPGLSKTASCAALPSACTTSTSTASGG
jgi:hypothetical protein